MKMNTSFFVHFYLFYCKCILMWCIRAKFSTKQTNAYHVCLPLPTLGAIYYKIHCLIAYILCTEFD